jgi:hypothetical protein
MEVETHSPKHRGVWFPPEISDLVAVGDMTTNEAFLLGIIDSLVDHSGEDCYASNEWLGKRIHLKGDMIKRMISHLKEMGLLVQTGFNGRKRYLRTIWSRFPGRRGIHSRADSANIPRQTGSKFPVENTKREYKENILDADASGCGGEQGFNGKTNGFGLTELEQTNNPTLVSSRSFQEKFFKRWELHYKRPYALTAPKKEMALMKNIHRALGGDAAEFGRVLDRYFANDQRFFMGHSIPKLHQELNQFRVTVTNENGEPTAEESVPAGRAVFSGRVIQGGYIDDDGNIEDEETE